MSVSPRSSVSQREGFGSACDVRPTFPFEIFTQLGGMSETTVLVVQQMYETYCQACVSIAQTEGLATGSQSSVSEASSVSRPNRRQRRRKAKQKAGFLEQTGSKSVASVSSASTEEYDLAARTGYCYLRLISDVCKSEAAGKLGYNPELSELARLPSVMVAEPSQLKFLRVSRVSPGYWHCDIEGEYPLSELMSSLSSVFRTAVGSLGSGWAPQKFFDLKHTDRIGFSASERFLSAGSGIDLAAQLLMANARGDGNTGSAVVSVGEYTGLFSGKVQYLNGSSMHSFPVERFCNKTKTHEVSVAIRSKGFGVVTVGEGWKVICGDVEFGKAGVVTQVFFKRACDFVVVSPIGYLAQNTRSCSFPVIFGTLIDKAMKQFIEGGTSDAWFAWQMDAPVLLRSPVWVPPKTVSQLKYTEVTDPLQDYKPVVRYRLEGEKVRPGWHHYLLGFDEMICYGHFRNLGNAHVRFLSYVSLLSEDAKVIMFGEVALATNLGPGHNSWSMRMVHRGDGTTASDYEDECYIFN